MEGRKVQRVGTSSLAVSLPIDWAKKAGIKPGDLILFTQEKDGSLKLVPSALAKQESEVKEAVVNSNLCDEYGMLERIIVGNYILGHDVIRIVSSIRMQGAHVEEVRRILRKLIGLGIIEETPNQIVLQCSVDPAKFPIYKVMGRLYIISSLMHEEAVKALIDSNFELAKEAISREDDADMMYYLTLRLLYSAQQDKAIAEKIGLVEPLHALSNRAIALLLERIGDWAENIAKNVLSIKDCRSEINESIVNGLSQLSKLASSICYKAMQSISKNDIKLANSAIGEYKKIIESEEERLTKEILEQVSNIYVVAHLRAVLYSIRRIAELGAEIAQMAINRGLEKSSKICEVY
ncbi:MAG: AbrB/MazE/SpoVT family DNA-binding domain-containing protein [archaeon]|nr:AbrB/MazE/SpoVT family DNA-binding domain-containing protein [archaeon]MCP8314042.1 AbrB/MazE/SpoVT family DNA-binding domain-containing protein [archaeon]MCP8315667.1 AbrB/MazE/SpoVT family DNA-binding domain-containing protein [archaeon]MCP8320409.1 AbrB/MazE/SpoVT family DNA-binding domain-containing protein [archaeon]